MVNIALVGYGYWGPNVARNIFNNNEYNLVTICDKRVERLNKAKKIYIEQVCYETEFKKILDNKKIQAVAIAVETSSHFKLAYEALIAGKDIYIEKPFTSSVAEAIELKNLAEKEGRIIHVDHIMIYHPCIKLIKKIINDGTLGELMYFDASRMNLGQVKQDVSAMWDLAVHDLSIVDFFCDGINPNYISAIGEKHYSAKESLTFLNFKTGSFIGHIKSSWLSPFKERKFIIAGSKKMIVFDDLKIDEKLFVYDKGFDLIQSEIEYENYAIRTRTGDVWSPHVPLEDALYNSLDHFRECIVNRKSSQSGPDQAIRIQHILEEADTQLKEKD